MIRLQISALSRPSNTEAVSLIPLQCAGLCFVWTLWCHPVIYINNWQSNVAFHHVELLGSMHFKFIIPLTLGELPDPKYIVTTSKSIDCGKVDEPIICCGLQQQARCDCNRWVMNTSVDRRSSSGDRLTCSFTLNNSSIHCHQPERQRRREYPDLF